MNEPHLIQFLLNIAGAAALLIWAVGLVLTGVERGFSAKLRFWLRHSTKNEYWPQAPEWWRLCSFKIQLLSQCLYRTLLPKVG